MAAKPQTSAECLGGPHDGDRYDCRGCAVGKTFELYDVQQPRPARVPRYVFGPFSYHREGQPLRTDHVFRFIGYSA